VEGGNFRAMTIKSAGDWHFCDTCGHLATVGNPDFRCTCRHCVRLYTKAIDIPALGGKLRDRIQTFYRNLRSKEPQ